jgi:glutamate-1-semialdehyde 2,1-aminomutase
VKGRATGLGSLRRIHLTDAPLSDYRSTFASGEGVKRVAQLAKNLFDQGVIIAGNGLMCFSTPMTGSDVDEILAAFDRAIARL